MELERTCCRLAAVQPYETKGIEEDREGFDWGRENGGGEYRAGEERWSLLLLSFSALVFPFIFNIETVSTHPKWGP